MKWRCEWCEKPHEENDPPCDNCGHGTFEKAVTQVSTESVSGGPVWVCEDCGRVHQKHSPPCTRCGGADLSRRTDPPDTDPAADIDTAWRDILEPKYVVGYLLAAGLLAFLGLSAVGVVSLPGGEQSAGPPEIPTPPGSGETIGTISLSDTENEYVDRLNEYRANESAGSLRRNDSLGRAAAYYTKSVVGARYGTGSRPDRDRLTDFSLPCDRPQIVSYQVALERTGRPAAGFETERAIASALVTSYVERGKPFVEGDAIGIDIHIAPDGTAVITYVVC
jgi:hypothetical protein